MHTLTADRPAAIITRTSDLRQYNSIRDHIEAIGSLVNVANAAARALDSEVSDTMTVAQKTLVIERVWDEIVRAIASAVNR
ncbi:hypothetical protein H7J07_05830 [Mycobacterium koreense]|uniref:Uncharacterized protein n=1 Tax=Mycolicibacillus koreensis TaxID=1069220 RepID=A0A7I7SCX8_9MYCO|nr:hypothetical protein [Mycolicibacillus koreensis]MCV7247745.1 hypothetical protein [Mycolicibacillus koreensis]OSC34730.1 hypothetical protein B8W67_05635 [Mycolicibacillus koreensis]BBY54129.1 hypothetical protein MKOR_13800 [Mycolicibacillus koreensis]